MQIFELLDECDLSFIFLAPSTIRYLRPYFSDINCPSVKYCLFAGEALPEDVTLEWAKCIPNAEIFNVYGPTEDTIVCTAYKVLPNGKNKSHNGVLSIGKSMNGNCSIIIREDGKEAATDEVGELLLGGEQLFSGYWKNEEKTKAAFVHREDGCRFYKSGDLCFRDADGDILYCGRIDHQAKIQGFRVELGEIEFHASEFLDGVSTVCIAIDNGMGLSQLALFIEEQQVDKEGLLKYLKKRMPPYMIPSKIILEKEFPLNGNGKVDRKVLKSRLN